MQPGNIAARLQILPRKDRYISILLRNRFATLQQYLNVYPQIDYSEMFLKYFGVT